MEGVPLKLFPVQIQVSSIEETFKNRTKVRKKSVAKKDRIGMRSRIRKTRLYIVNCSWRFFAESRASCSVLEKMAIPKPPDMDTSYKDFMITRRGSVDINKDMVLSPDADLDTVMDYADELDVSLSGLNTVEEMRTRICMHLDFMESKGNPIEKVTDSVKERFQKIRYAFIKVLHLRQVQL